MNFIFRIRQSLGSQRTLRDCGPVIPASWCLPRGTGTAPPKPSQQVRGNLLVDTGAGHIAIDESVAHQLGLPALAKKEDVHGLGGKQSVTKYSASLLLTVEVTQAGPSVPPGSVTMIGIPLEVHGFQGLQENFQTLRIKPTNGLPVIGVLGRTFLQFTRFTYEGFSGDLIIEIDESVLHPQVNEHRF